MGYITYFCWLYLILGILAILQVCCIIGYLYYKAFKSGSYARGVINKAALKMLTEGIQAPKTAACAICMEDFTTSSSVTRAACLGQHVFHSHCFATWQRTNSTCPICAHALP